MWLETCEHPVERIRVVFDITKRGQGYWIAKPRAHCIGCNSSLQPTDRHGILAIDLVMAKIGSAEKREAISLHRHEQGLQP